MTGQRARIGRSARGSADRASSDVVERDHQPARAVPVPVPVRRSPAAPTVGAERDPHRAAADLATDAPIARIRRDGDAIHRMTQKDGATPITTLVALNAYLKQFQKGVSLDAEADFDDAPTKDIDAAIAGSTMKVTGDLKKNQLVGEIKSRMSAAVEKAGARAKKVASGKIVEVPEDPQAARKAAAKKIPTQEGQYYGGGANELHVHDIGGALHVKVGKDDRKNIYVNGKLRTEVLKEVRSILAEHPRGAVLNAAVDKGLLEYNLPLDDY